jgi:hypothetical protein
MIWTMIFATDSIGQLRFLLADRDCYFAEAL